MNTPYKKYFKPLFDTGLAFIGILLVSPLIFFITTAIKIESKGPVLFKQTRLGLNGSIFKIYKFRSMVSDQSRFKKTHGVYEDDPRITRVGRFIRKTSLDELPQLINILRGEMSFIGPRPPVTHYPKKYEEYNDFEKQRFLVKPGISGLAQVRCREENDWDVNIPIDVEYVENISFKNDFRLFFISLTFFFRTDNIYSKKTL